MYPIIQSRRTSYLTSYLMSYLMLLLPLLFAVSLSQQQPQLQQHLDECEPVPVQSDKGSLLATEDKSLSDLVSTNATPDATPDATPSSTVNTPPTTSDQERVDQETMPFCPICTPCICDTHNRPCPVMKRVRDWEWALNFLGNFFLDILLFKAIACLVAFSWSLIKKI